jgi:hypothetical protein
MDMVEDGIERNVTTNSIKNQSCNENKDHDDHLDHMDDFDALESQLAAIEARSSTTPSSSATTSVKKKNTINKTKSTGTGNTTTSPIDGFPCYMLYGLQEPPAIQLYNKVSIQDKDDVGLSGSTTSKNDQRKIQQMLQQYMEEMEDDVDMLHLLQQQQQQQPSSSLSSSSNKYNGKSSKNPMERDERLSVMDRALFTYMDRLKRIPRQVLRHGIGTLPLWSMYVKSTSAKHTLHNTKSFIFQQSGSHLSCILMDLFLFLYLDLSYHSNSNNRNCQVTNMAREIASRHHRLWHRRKGINRRKFTAMNNHYRLVLFVVLGYGSNYKYYHQYCMC